MKITTVTMFSSKYILHMADNLEQSISTIDFALDVVGSTVPVTINSGIYSHNVFLEDLDINQDRIIINGTTDHPISLQDVRIAFVQMQRQFSLMEDTGRSYYYEGFKLNQSTGEYEIYWGS